MALDRYPIPPDLVAFHAYLESRLAAHLSDRKFTVSLPRQCGKTFMAKRLYAGTDQQGASAHAMSTRIDVTLPPPVELDNELVKQMAEECAKINEAIIRACFVPQSFLAEVPVNSAAVVKIRADQWPTLSPVPDAVLYRSSVPEPRTKPLTPAQRLNPLVQLDERLRENQ